MALLQHGRGIGRGRLQQGVIPHKDLHAFADCLSGAPFED